MQEKQLALRPAPQTKAPKLLDKRLVLKRIYRQFPTLRLNQLVAKAVLEQPKLKLREAEMYFRVRRQQSIHWYPGPHQLSSRCGENQPAGDSYCLPTDRLYTCIIQSDEEPNNLENWLLRTQYYCSTTVLHTAYLQVLGFH